MDNDSEGKLEEQSSNSSQFLFRNIFGERKNKTNPFLIIQGMGYTVQLVSRKIIILKKYLM